MLNRVVLVGRLAKDPQYKTLSTGTSFCSFTLAVQRTFRDRNGTQGTDWIPVVVWGQTAENCNRYLSKGRMTAVSGRIQTRNYEKDDGSKVYVTEVVADEVQFLGNAEKPKETFREEDPFDEGAIPF